MVVGINMANIYRSTDPGAPVLNKNAGTLINVLTACLVTGYGTKTGAGWTKPYTSGEYAAFRMSTTAPGSTGSYLQIRDIEFYAEAKAFKTMTAIGVGTDESPPAGTGNYLFKSYDNSNQPPAAANTPIDRPWTIIADTRAVYIFINVAATTWGTTTQSDGFLFFGDIVTRKSNDAYNCAIIGQVALPNIQTTSSQGVTYTVPSQTGVFVGWAYTVLQGYREWPSFSNNFILRSYTGIGSAMRFALTRIFRNTFVNEPIGTYNGTNIYPDRVNTGLNLVSIALIEKDTPFAIRGTLPGIYEPLGAFSVTGLYSIIEGQGNLQGQQFIAMPAGYSTTGSFSLNSGNYGIILFKLTGSWY